jgi:hypothetical protein
VAAAAAAAAAASGDLSSVRAVTEARHEPCPSPGRRADPGVMVRVRDSDNE